MEAPCIADPERPVVHGPDSDGEAGGAAAVTRPEFADLTDDTYGSINWPIAALMRAWVRVGTPSLRRALSR
jgi:hypothetical protein